MKKQVVLLLVCFLLAMVGCSEEDYLDEDGYPVDDAYIDDTQDGDPVDGYECAGFWDCLLGEEYVETAEDCYSDEYFDEEDQLCYLTEDEWSDEDCPECAADFWGTLGELVGVVFSGHEGSTEALISYEINGSELVNPQLGGADSDQLRTFQQDTGKHTQIWRQFITLFPDGEREHFNKYEIFTDGPSEVMAHVYPSTEDLSFWVLAVDIQDAADEKELVYTLIHEYAHVMTLNNEQVDASIGENKCADYFPGEGCALNSSYIDAFHDQFWQPVFEELGVANELELAEDDMSEYYSSNEDQFVTDYAATNPGEDIAESFTNFVLNKKPTGDTIADQKMLFFYQYPELVALRQQLASRSFSRLRRK